MLLKIFSYIFLLSINYILSQYNQNYQNNQNSKSSQSRQREVIVDPYCVNLSKDNVNMKNVTNKQYTQAFINGPCAPIVIIPGFLGTKLEFAMQNTTKFEENHQDIIKNCNWKNLKAKEIQKFSLWINTDIDFMAIAMKDQSEAEKSSQKKVEKEYVPKLFKKIIINGSEMKEDVRSKCYGSLLRNYFSVNSNNEIVFEQLKGAVIRPVLKDMQQCGGDAISNFLDQYSSFVKFTKGFNDLIKHLEGLGYKHGLSLFSFPYDWRLPPHHHEKSLNKTINLAYAITKKKSLVLGHSLGGLLAYNIALKNNKLIERVISIGTPYLGSPKSIEIALAEDTNFNHHKKFNAMFFEVEIETGADSESLKLLTASSANKFTFLPKPTIKDEVDENIKKIVGKIFPGKSEAAKCAQTIEYLDRKTVCLVPEFDFYTHAMFSINKDHGNHDEYFKEEHQLVNFLDEHKYYNDHDVLNFDSDVFSHNTHLKINELLYMKHLSNEGKGVFTFQNPGVPFVFIYGNHLPMPSRFELKTEDYGSTKLKKVVRNTPGDGTVDGLSQIYPGLRWLSESDLNSNNSNNNNENLVEGNNNTFHFIEYCAHSKEHEFNTHLDFNKSQYLTMSCECLTNKKLSPVDDCNHSTILTDKYFISVVEKIIKAKKYEKILVNSYSALYNREYKDDLKCMNLK
jgi:lecithin-cholesterol acyltransferase